MVKFAAAQDSAFKADKALAMQMSAFGRKADMTRRRILIGRSVLSLASSVEVTMTRLIFASVAALAGVSFGPTAQAYEAPWCAVIERGNCYRRGTILAGNRGFCNPSPYYVGKATEHRRVTKRGARPQ